MFQRSFTASKKTLFFKVKEKSLRKKIYIYINRAYNSVGGSQGTHPAELGRVAQVLARFCCTRRRFPRRQQRHAERHAL